MYYPLKKAKVWNLKECWRWEQELNEEGEGFSFFYEDIWGFPKINDMIG